MGKSYHKKEHIIEIMHKLIILFESPDDEQAFQLGWQKFLGLAEQLPGLRRETVSRVAQRL